MVRGFSLFSFFWGGGCGGFKGFLVDLGVLGSGVWGLFLVGLGVLEFGVLGLRACRVNRASGFSV